MKAPKPAPLLLRNVRTAWGAAPVDLVVADGAVADLVPAGTGVAAEGVVVEDGGGALVLPALVDAHCHVDKSLWGRPWVPHSAGPALADRIANGESRRAELGLPDPASAQALLAQMVAQGTTAIRTHTDVDPQVGLAGLEAVAEAAAGMGGAIDVQQVAFPQGGLLMRPGTSELLREALATGLADCVGGLDPAAVDRDAVRHLDLVFGLAAEHGARLDIHLHERGTLGAHTMELVIERTERHGLQGRVALSHAVAIVDVERPHGDRLAAGLAEHDIALVTATVYNTPVLPLGWLAGHGVTVAAGNDGIRDLWGPYGTGDMLERAFLMAYRNGFRRDDEIEAALDAVVRGGARVLGRPEGRVSVGGAADLVLVDASGVAEAVAVRPPRRLVVKGGRVVARAGMGAVPVAAAGHAATDAGGAEPAAPGR
ncbi:amidohydrolase [Phycicoccus sp. M110.8]|uniref:amidohydrolase n=1 Tax=Phycicoccus sp. M110.8 TaxID=3075433 RepID=UPI0028FDA300|nr:amidohydrolase [Phycicoccus sp. M110.8]MDU0313068.1 amidohydrolase [Phycicoccus sp. M110.8]